MSEEKCPHIEKGICVECEETVAPFRAENKRLNAIIQGELRDPNGTGWEAAEMWSKKCKEARAELAKYQAQGYPEMSKALDAAKSRIAELEDFGYKERARADVHLGSIATMQAKLTERDKRIAELEAAIVLPVIYGEDLLERVHKAEKELEVRTENYDYQRRRADELEAKVKTMGDAFEAIYATKDKQIALMRQVLQGWIAWVDPNSMIPGHSAWDLVSRTSDALFASGEKK